VDERLDKVETVKKFTQSFHYSHGEPNYIPEVRMDVTVRRLENARGNPVYAQSQSFGSKSAVVEGGVSRSQHSKVIVARLQGIADAAGGALSTKAMSENHFSYDLGSPER